MNFLRNLFRKKRPAQVELDRDRASPMEKRLARGAALLDRLEFERKFRAQPAFGRSTEERIIWRELFDLELQALDEQTARRVRESDWA